MPINKETLQTLAARTIAFEDTRIWWVQKMEETAKKLDEVCSRGNPEDFEAAEKLQKELEFWNRRGEQEEKQYKDFIIKSHDMLRNNLMSGISSLNLKKQ